MTRGDTSDLLCRARREELSAEEHRRLEGLLESSAEARLMSAMLSEFERESQVRAGDDVLLARIGARALRKSGGASAVEAPFSRRLSVRLRSRVALAVAAAVLLMGSLAFGWRLSVSRRAAPSPAPMPSVQAPTSQHVMQPRMQRRDSTAPPDEQSAPELAPLQEHAPPLSTARKSPPRAAHSAATDTVDGASELFANANLLRRQGKNDEAVRVYQRLVTEHAQSREASPARLALGKLLRVKEPARALVQFRALAEQRGPLRPEALWGIAEASRSLGQSAVEARALDDLVREFPDSPYADAARARIADGAR